jgi:hypothetical protein
MIEELTEAAEEAIETAAAEAAKAAVMASLEREAAAIREAQQWRGEYGALKSKSFKNAAITGVICFLSGFALGAGSVLIIQGGR